MKLQILFLSLQILFIFSLKVKSNDHLLFSDNNVESIEQIVSLASQDSVLSPPKFSHESGFYPNDFTLLLTSSDEDSIIYYTIDGTNPLTSKAREKYNEEGIKIYDRSKEPNIYGVYEEDENSAISISRGCNYKQPRYPLDKGMIVRAVTVKDNQQSKVVDYSYFVTTGDLKDYEDIFIVSLVTNPENLFDPEIGIYVTGNQYISWITSPGYVPNPDKWSKTINKCNYYSRGKEWEREASVSFFDKGKLLLHQDIGIRLKGSSTRNAPQKSFDLLAREEYGKSYFDIKFFEENYGLDGKVIDKYDAISMRGIYGNERIRDKFARDIVYKRKSTTTSWMKSCVLFLNGEYWGMYELMEKTSPFFFEQHYGVSNNNLVVIKENEIDEGQQEECDKYLQKAEQLSFLDFSNDKNYEEIEEFIDMDSFMEHYAIGIYLGTWDWPLQNSGIWRNTGNKVEGNEYTDGKWRFITYDLDFSMGLTFENYGGVEGYQYDNFKHVETRRGNKIPTNLFLSLLKKNDLFKTKFINLFCDYANEVMKPERISSLLDGYNDKIAWMFSNGKARWWGSAFSTKLEGYSFMKIEFENEIMKKLNLFFEQRGKYTLQHLQNYLGLKEELVELTISMKGEGKVQINTIIPEFKDGKWKGKYFTNVPITITAIPNNNKEFKGWSGDATSDEKVLTLTLKEATTIEAAF